MTVGIASSRPWNHATADRLAERTGIDFVRVDDRSQMTVEYLAERGVNVLFVLHWSWIIPPTLFEAVECVIFHMTDLPYGRGGSPLQNLIQRGHDSTVISALRCVRELDAGPIYMKKPLSLLGSAEEIFLRADRVIEEMIVEWLETRPEPQPQEGEVTTFTRRRDADGDLSSASSLDEAYDFIRMLDAEGYPRAYLDVGGLRIRFSRASRKADSILADVEIRERPDTEAT